MTCWLFKGIMIDDLLRYCTLWISKCAMHTEKVLCKFWDTQSFLVSSLAQRLFSSTSTDDAATDPMRIWSCEQTRASFAEGWSVGATNHFFFFFFFFFGWSRIANLKQLCKSRMRLKQKIPVHPIRIQLVSPSSKESGHANNTIGLGFWGLSISLGEGITRILMYH
jgi:hypothetical protein